MLAEAAGRNNNDAKQAARTSPAIDFGVETWTQRRQQAWQVQEDVQMVVLG